MMRRLRMLGLGSWYVNLCIFAGASVGHAKLLVSVIPYPGTIVVGEECFVLTPLTRILVTKETESLGQQLGGLVRPATGFDLPLSSIFRKSAPEKNIIKLAIEADDTLGEEGYRLQVTPNAVVLSAPTPAGLFYGIQTLRQLLPPEIETRTVVTSVEWKIPAVAIRDKPRFTWRGLMLDESRHFMGMETVKKIMDAMALLKLNRFHWHLTDSHGWRLEIKRYPALTAVAAVGDYSNPERPAQFYTQEQVREILAYARDRHIMVIPEIELPAHSTAALRAFPNLSCTGKPEFMYCAGNDEALRFLEGVLDEVCELFDSPFIHVGGDECPKNIWNRCRKCQARIKTNGLKDALGLQSWMIRHFDRYLTQKGRRLIGWDEILEGGLAPGATVMSWQGVEGGQAASAMGHDVVMSPRTYLYLDYPQFHALDGYKWFRVRVNSCERIVAFNPFEGISAENQRHVLGLHGALWTEYCHDGKEAEWMTFPRAAAIAERAWSPDAEVSWERFRARAPGICARLKAMGLRVAPFEEPEWARPAAEWKPGELSQTWVVRDWDVTSAITEAGPYTVRFNYNMCGRLDVKNVALLENGKEIARDARQSVVWDRMKLATYTITLPAAKPGAAYTLRAEVIGSKDSNGTICVFPSEKESNWLKEN